MILSDLVERVAWLRQFIRFGLKGRIFLDLLEMRNRIYENMKAFSSYKGHLYSDDDVLVNIIVPTHNEVGNIVKLLKSIRLTPYRNIEVIIADYRSSDGTPDVAEDFGARVLNIDRLGIGYASHKAVQEARGDIIVRTDADAMFPPFIIPHTVEIFRKKPSVKILSIGHIYYEAGLIDNIVAFLFDKYLRKPSNTTGHFIAFKKEVKEKVNFNPQLRYHEDWDFGLRAYRELGAEAFHYDYKTCILVSARRIEISGRLNYLLGNVRR